MLGSATPPWIVFRLDMLGRFLFGWKAHPHAADRRDAILLTSTIRVVNLNTNARQILGFERDYMSDVYESFDGLE